MDDTPLEITKKMAAMMQLKSPVERLKMGSSMYDTSKFLVIRAIKEENPGISKSSLRKEIFLRYYRDDFDPQARDQILSHLENIGSMD